LAIVPKRRSLEDPRHLMRFLKHQAKMTPKEIARSENVSETTVKQSISLVERYQAQNSTGEMEFAIRNFVIGTIPKAKKTLEGLLDATELVEVKDPTTGKTKLMTREDKTTRIEALRIVRDVIGHVQPKVPTTEVNVNQTNQIANLSTAETTEERLARLRKLADEAYQLPPEVAGVPSNVDKGEDDDDGEDEEEEDE